MTLLLLLRSAAETTPVVTFVSQTRTKISRVAGSTVDATDVVFSADQNWNAYQVRLVSSSESSIAQGQLVEGATLPTAAGVTRTITITDDELVAAGATEGSNLLKIFVTTAAGTPSQMVREPVTATAAPAPAPTRDAPPGPLYVPQEFTQSPEPVTARRAVAPRTLTSGVMPSASTLPATTLYPAGAEEEPPVVIVLGYGRVGIDYLGPDVIAPGVNATPSRTRISRVNGASVDAVSVDVTSDEPVLEYQVRIVSSEVATVAQGTLVEGAVLSNGLGVTRFHVVLTDDELVAAGASEGSNVVKIFVRDPGGNWSG